MQLLSLPKTKLRVSEFCLGAADFASSVSEEESGRMLDRFVEAGGNFLDTAAIYAAWDQNAGKGSSERRLARWFRRRGRHDDIVIATKGGHPELKTMQTPRLDRASVASDLEDSLRNLGVETIDLYYVHRDDWGRPVEEILGYLEEFVRTGKIRHYAFSNWKLFRAEAARQAALRDGCQGFVASQQLWSLAEGDMSKHDPTAANIDAPFAAWHREHNVPALPFTAQANGYFSKLAEGREADFKPWTRALYDHPTNRRRFAALQELRQATGLSITQVVLGYLRSQPFTVVPVIGPKSIAQLNDCLTAAGVRLVPGQLAALTVA